MLFRPRRDKRGPDRFLAAKTAILAIAALVAIAGFALRIDWLVTVAIFILVIGLGFNISRRFTSTAAADAESSADEEP